MFFSKNILLKKIFSVKIKYYFLNGKNILFRKKDKEHTRVKIHPREKARHNWGKNVLLKWLFFKKTRAWCLNKAKWFCLNVWITFSYINDLTLASQSWKMGGSTRHISGWLEWIDNRLSLIHQVSLVNQGN